MIDIDKIVYDYPTKNKQGFVQSEIDKLITEHNMDADAFYKALGVNTCMIIKGEIVTYHCDIAKAFHCVIENRDQTLDEWD